MRGAWAAAIALGVSALAAPALGKGASLEIDEYENVGAHVVATEDFFSERKKELRRWTAGGPYYVYISTGWANRWRQAPPLPDDAQKLALVEIGRIKKSDRRWWSVQLRAEFTLEGFRPGKYRIDVCSSPCTQTIEELYASTFRIVADPVEKRVQQGLDNMRFDVAYLMHEANWMRMRVRGASKGFDRFFTDAHEEFAQQSERIDNLVSALREVRTKTAERRPSLFPAGLAFGAGALLASAAWFLAPRLATVRALPKRKKAAAHGSSR